MKFDVGDKNRCRLVCVKFQIGAGLQRMFRGLTFLDTV